MAQARTEYHAIIVVAGSANDSALVPALARQVDGIVVGTDKRPGTPADADLMRCVASLAAPTLELLSSPMVAAPPVAVGAAGM